MTADEQWYHIDAPRLKGGCFAIVVTDGIVTDAAPLARWAIGVPWFRARAWFIGKGATIVALANEL